MSKAIESRRGHTPDKDQPRIVLVESDPATRAACRMYLQNAGWAVETPPDTRAAIALLKRPPRDYAAVITNVLTRRIDGLKIIHAVKELVPRCRIVAVIGARDAVPGIIERDLAVSIGVDETLFKPYSRAELLAAIGRGVAKIPRRA